MFQVFFIYVIRKRNYEQNGNVGTPFTSTAIKFKAYVTNYLMCLVFEADIHCKIHKFSGGVLFQRYTEGA